jgi:hypothetical protein
LFQDHLPQLTAKNATKPFPLFDFQELFAAPGFIETPTRMFVANLILINHETLQRSRKLSNFFNYRQVLATRLSFYFLPNAYFSSRFRFRPVCGS